MHLKRPLSRRIPTYIALLALALVLSWRPALARVAPGNPPSGPTESDPNLTTPPNNVVVALTAFTTGTPVELVALTLDVNISEAEGHTLAQGSTTFKLHNSDPINPVTLTVGFPDWGGGNLSFDPGQFSLFQVTTDNKKMSLTTSSAPVTIGKETRAANWYVFDLTLDPDEKQLVRVDFAQDLGTSIMPRFTYGILPSRGWKGSIGSARLAIRFPAPTEGDQFIALDPSLPEFDGQSVTWLWTDVEPAADPGLTFIKLSSWKDLQNDRAAATRNPDSAAAHVALARDYQSLASQDSPRRDNYSSAAIAELESASRLDPKNVDAISSLAQFYEGRAGAPEGPRDVSYVTLALGEWKSLLGTRADADAKAHASEDSFYLGLAAKTAGDMDLAHRYLQDAAQLQPKGAGPLYTPARWKSEMENLGLALAQADVKAGQLDQALVHARQAFGEDFNLSPAPAFPSFAVGSAEVTTSSSERKIVIRLLAYPGTSDEAKTQLSGVAAQLNRSGVGSVSASAASGSYVLTLAVPYNSARDLQNKLEKLARAFPEREDWNVIRAVVQSSGIEIEQSGNALTQSVHYQENVDFDPPYRPLESTLGQLSRTVDDLSRSAQTNPELALRLELLKDSQAWWTRTGGGSQITYSLELDAAPLRRWSVQLGESKTLTFDEQSIRSQWYFIGAGLVLLLAVLFLIAIKLIRGPGRRLSNLAWTGQ